MQRDRNFADYQDDGVFYDRRPSAWVEPIGDWGAGSVQLVEIPTAGETDDNIVAFWVPAAPVRAGQATRPALPAALGQGGADAARRRPRRRDARQGEAWAAGPADPAGRRKFVVDFAGAALHGLTRESGVQPVVTSSAGQPIDAAAYPVRGRRTVWRLMFDFQAPAGTTLDLRALPAPRRPDR